jgi:hypothetical protein
MSSISEVLDQLIDLCALEQKRLEQSFNVPVADSVTPTELLTLAQQVLAETAKIKKIRHMLDDIKSLLS